MRSSLDLQSEYQPFGSILQESKLLPRFARRLEQAL
jgi:hypothetical protein